MLVMTPLGAPTDCPLRIWSSGSARMARKCRHCGAPYISNNIFCMDWLHAADLRVAQDFVRHVLMHLIERRRVPGVIALRDELCANLQRFFTATTPSKTDCII